jgi:vacuolar-type H+-ATPase subunit F/Vma7
MQKIAIVGDPDQILAFTAVGIETMEVTDEPSAVETVRRLAEEGYAVILVQERFYRALSDVLERYAGQVTPCISAVPGGEGSQGLALEALREIVKKAVGADIFAQGGLAR